MARIDPIPPLVGAVVGAADGFVVHLDQKASRYACATRELKTPFRAAVAVAGLTAAAFDYDPDISQGLAVSGSFLLASRVSLGIARGSAVAKGRGC